MLYPFGDNVKITGVQDDITIPKLDRDLPKQHKKKIIRFRMRVPDKFAVYFDNHHVVAIELRHNLG